MSEWGDYIIFWGWVTVWGGIAIWAHWPFGRDADREARKQSKLTSNIDKHNTERHEKKEGEPKNKNAKKENAK